MTLFGTSGIRREVMDLTPEFVSRLGLSLGTYVYASDIPPTVAVGRDPRTSSEMLEAAFVSGLLATGCSAIALGMVTTPTLAMAAEKYGTGIMITASHNPPQYNGLKFWGERGAYRPAQEGGIERIMAEGEFRFSDWSGIGSVRRDSFTREHADRIIKAFGRADEKASVLIDCANGAGTSLTPQLLSEMGCEVIAINAQPDGFFPAHGLEPTAENLKETAIIVKSLGADVGIVHDGDADRAAAIDGSGKLIPWDKLLSALAYGSERVVTTVDASMCIEEVCGEVIRTPVGDVSVADAMLLEGADFGGEPSGSFIFSEVHLVPDGPAAAAKVATMVSGGAFYDILDRIPSYPVERLKIPCEDEKKEPAMSALMEKIDEDNMTDIDGIRVSWDEGWLLIRPSGTEPFLRITAEAKSAARLKEIVKTGKEWLSAATADL